MTPAFRLLSMLCIILIGPLVVDQSLTEAGELVQSSSCKVIGRVLRSEDPGIRKNAPLCEGGTIQVSDRQKVYVSCYERSNNQWLSNGIHLINRLCGEQNAVETACLLTIGCTRFGTQIVLLNPRVGVFEEAPKELDWSSIPNTQYYEILISGLEETYKTQTQESRLDITQVHSLQPGQIYQVEILAVGKTSVLGKTQASIQVLSPHEIQELNETLSIIESSELTQDEKIKLVDAAYMSMGLTDKAIAYLELEAQNSKTPLIARLLADRYAEVGNALKAEENYEYVAKVSSKASEEFKHAQKMLNRIAALQSTTTNFR